MVSRVFIFFEEASGRSLIAPPPEGVVEHTILNLVKWLELLIETVGVVIIGIGVAVTAFQIFRTLLPPHMKDYNRIRLTLARYLALALEFQPGADILSTAIAPSWDQIGKLGAIAVIRTALNYFLNKEMQQERRGAESEGKAESGDESSGDMESAKGRKI